MASEGFVSLESKRGVLVSLFQQLDEHPERTRHIQSISGFIKGKSLLYPTMLKLLLALTGLLCGLLLSFLAAEEIKTGKLYFIWMKRVLFALIVVLADYYVFILGNYLLLILFSILAVLIFSLHLKIKKKWYEAVNYGLFMIFYFFIQQQTGQLLVAAGIFMYGLPAGSVLRTIND